jgi:hypothetical protein
MIFLARLLFIIRWPFALPFCLAGLFFAIPFAVFLADAEVFGSWWDDMVYPALLRWPR